MAVLLAVGAHPDDETMFAGGMLAWVARRGLTVRILDVTRGEGGEVGDPPVTTQERLGETREAEVRCAGEALGVAGVDFLPFVDPLVTHTGTDPAPSSALFRIAAEPEEFERAVVEVVRAVRADVLLTHGTNGEYGHPQHRYTHETVRRAFDSAGDGARFPGAGEPYAPAALYTWAAYFPTGGDVRLERLLNQDDPAEWFLALDEELLDRKERAALCHRSQLALFLRRSDGKPVREILLAREPFRRAALRAGMADDPLGMLLTAEPRASRATRVLNSERTEHEKRYDLNHEGTTGTKNAGKGTRNHKDTKITWLVWSPAGGGAWARSRCCNLRSGRARPAAGGGPELDGPPFLFVSTCRESPNDRGMKKGGLRRSRSAPPGPRRARAGRGPGAGSGAVRRGPAGRG